MTAYVIVDTKITGPEAYEDYKVLASPIVEKYGGKYIVRGGDMDLVEGDLWAPSRIVILQFADMASARKMLDSEEYTPVKAIRHANADCTAVIVDGF